MVIWNGSIYWVDFPRSHAPRGNALWTLCVRYGTIMARGRRSQAPDNFFLIYVDHRAERVKKLIQRVPLIGTDFVNKAVQESDQNYCVCSNFQFQVSNFSSKQRAAIPGQVDPIVRIFDFSNSLDLCEGA